MERNGLKIEFKEYNNKGRNGTYIVITDKKKKKKGMYKYDTDMPVDSYLLLYQHKGDFKTVGRLKKLLTEEAEQKKYEAAWTKVQKYLKTLKTTNKNINKVFKTGVTRTIIDPNRMNNNTIKKAYEKLFAPLVWDKEMLGLVIQNADKFRHRFEYQTNIMGTEHSTKNVKQLALINEIGKRTLQEYLIEYIIQDGAPVRQGSEIDSDWAERTKQKLKLLKDNVKQFTDSGTIETVKTVVIFRRGRK